MFMKKKEDSPANTIIGAGMKLEAAKLSGQEAVRIDGDYIGDLDLDGSIVVGETGSISGDMRAKHIQIAGRVNGTIRCDVTVHMTPTARVDGSIETKALITDEGACFNGNCQMTAAQSGDIALFSEGSETDFNKKFNRFVNSLNTGGK